ncbi:DUF1133 family protein, partial [Xanthomonas citri pv. citri]|nr:DUF1133 family protein [Xanthomonas citri pv. citri]
RRRMKKSGITKPELEAYLREILNSKNKSSLAFCSDDEGLKIDGVIASVLMNNDYRSLTTQRHTAMVPVYGPSVVVPQWWMVSPSYRE